MRLKNAIIVGIAAACLASQAALAQPAQTAPAPPTAVADGIPSVVAAGTVFERVGQGLDSVECGLGLADGSFLFCEVNTSRVMRVGLDGKIAVYAEDTNRAIGLTMDPKGRLISTQSREPRVGVVSPTRQTLADSFNGQPLVRPNDLVADRKGGVYFSDPVPPIALAFRPPPVGRKALLLYVGANGAVSQIMASEVGWNGVALSPDGKVLYAVEGEHVMAFDVQPDGSAKNPRVFAEFVADGLAVDNNGRLYGGTRQGIEVVAPDGRRLGLIKTPVRVQNLGFAGKDRKTMYWVGANEVYRFRMLATGIRSRLK